MPVEPCSEIYREKEFRYNDLVVTHMFSYFVICTF